jgi:predicted PurR-regulated permease PerM
MSVSTSGHLRSATSRDDSRAPTLLALLLAVAFVAICYFARDILLPFALAVLLSFLLAPLARRFQRWGLGRVGSVILAVLLAFSGLVATGYIVTRQVLDLAGNIPKYETQLTEKIEWLRHARSPELTEVAETIEHLDKEFSAPVSDGAGQQTTRDSDKTAQSSGLAPDGESESGEPDIATDLIRAFTARPLPVQIVDTTFMPVKLLRDASPLLSSLGSLAITTVFVIFMLLQRDDLRDRLIRLAGTSRVYLTTQALNDAASRVSRYLLMQLFINGVYGVAVAAGLWMIGLPNYLLWGLLAMLLRFIPYVGPIISCITPIALSLAVFPGWSRPLATAGMFIVLELVTNNVLEPWLYGSSTGVSTLGIIVAAVFWTWLWGPVGLVLATPLTVCVTVMARHMPQFYFLNILLADEPPLETRVRFYQRLLARDFDDAADLVADFLSKHTRAELGDQVLLPALNLAESDCDAGHLSTDSEEYIYESVGELISDLDELDTAADDSGKAAADGGSPPAPTRDVRILCVAAEDTADHLGGELLARLLGERGFGSDVCFAAPPGEELVTEFSDDEIDGIVISTVAPRRGALRSRRVCLNLRRRYPNAKLLAGLWHSETDTNRTRQRLAKTGADAVVATLSDALGTLEEWFPPPPAEPAADNATVERVADSSPRSASIPASIAT